MQVSSKSRYALRALVELELRTGGGSRPVRIADLASERDLPGQFLEQLFAALRRSGILRSHRGVDGGFHLRAAARGGHGARGRRGARRPRERRRLYRGECDLEDLCGASLVWHEAVDAFEAVLVRTTIADLAERERLQTAGQPMYQI